VLVRLSKRDAHASRLMGADTVKLCEMQGFEPRLENDKQSRVEANIYGFKAEFAVARLFDLDPPTVNVLTDGGADLWFDEVSIDVKFTNSSGGPLIFDNIDKFKAQCAVLVYKTDDENVMHIGGWMSRKEFSETARKHDFGYGERLVVDSKNLRPVETLWRKMMVTRYQ